MQVPTLETPEGGVFESNAIARYVARLADTGLFGTTLLDTVGCLLQRGHSDSNCWTILSRTLSELADEQAGHV